ncbi:MAG TPA: CopG family transcriptional regulator [Allosphingosinicella sp.]
MTKQHVITARIDDETLTGLNRMAEYHDRSRAWLVAKAVERYVKEETEFFAFIQEGEDSFNRGDYLTHEELVAELDARYKDHKAKRAA